MRMLLCKKIFISKKEDSWIMMILIAGVIILLIVTVSLLIRPIKAALSITPIGNISELTDEPSSSI
jgi:hypothetical protein